MSAAIEYILQSKAGCYDDLLDAYAQFAAEFDVQDAELIVVSGDPAAGTLRALAVRIPEEGSTQATQVRLLEDFAEAYAHLLDGPPQRESLELVHVFVSE